MIYMWSSAMLPGVAEREPTRMWFGKGGCFERRDDGVEVPAGVSLALERDGDDGADRRRHEAQVGRAE
jgi:hypothetical protein